MHNEWNSGEERAYRFFSYADAATERLESFGVDFPKKPGDAVDQRLNHYYGLPEGFGVGKVFGQTLDPTEFTLDLDG